MVKTTASSRAAGGSQSALPPVPGSEAKHAHYHRCLCYGHEKNLPNYKLLALPRTNNYYAATGGCPCIPRAPAHPGSWRLKAAQMRSTTHSCGTGCTQRRPVSEACCLHSGDQYGWKCGPHTVRAKNTAATGKCDTFGNMAFKSRSRAYLPAEDNVSDVSSASPQKIEDLEALIREEYAARVEVERDVEELMGIHASGTSDLYKLERKIDEKRRLISDPTKEQMDDLLREILDIVRRPLNQTNMDLLRRIIRRQEALQRRRDYVANTTYNENTVS